MGNLLDPDPHGDADLNRMEADTNPGSGPALQSIRIYITDFFFKFKR